MPNGILCGNCKNIISFNMINAVMSNSCPFCGFEFASQGFAGLQECYTDIVDMFPSFGSLDFDMLKGIVRFVFGPKFEEDKNTLAKHLDVLAKIFNFNAVDESSANEDKISPSDIEIAPVRSRPSPPKAPRITSGLGVTVKNKRVKRRGDGDDDEDSGGKDRRMPSQTTLEVGGTFLTAEAISELPKEFRDRATSVRTDADLRSLLRDVAFKNLEGLDDDV